jgi:hypothetical protein
MADTAQPLAQGILVLGRYRPLRPLGAGGSGSVWLARDVRAGREVALKIVPREGNAAARAEREARAAARLRHPGCLRACALARDSGHVYIAYEYVPGRTLRQALRAGELDDTAALEVGAQLLDALAHAHAHGIVHRDVKPANVLLCAGPRPQVKLFDFGLALVGDEETLTAAGDVPGTLAYTSPERLRGRPAGPAADVWAVGVILWEALAGRHPFWAGTVLDTARRIDRGAPSLRTLRPDLPPEVLDCVELALAPDPDRRPSARVLAGRLRRAAAHGKRRSPRQRSRPCRAGRIAPRLAHAAAAGAAAAWSTATFPFFPAGWPPALGVAVAAIALLGERSALALALALPVLPLGNYALGLALLYALVAAAWLAAFWREPRAGLLAICGPLLAPLEGVGLAPLVLQAVRHPLRRALATAAAVLLAGLARGGARLSDLAIPSSERPTEAASALVATLRPALVAQALLLALAAVFLPLLRRRGPWPLALLGGALMAALGLVAPVPATAPLLLGVLLLSLLLWLEPRLRRGQPQDPSLGQPAPALPLRPAREAAGGG